MTAKKSKRDRPDVVTKKVTPTDERKRTMNEKRASDGDGATPAVQVTNCSKSLIGSSGIDISARHSTLKHLSLSSLASCRMIR